MLLITYYIRLLYFVNIAYDELTPHGVGNLNLMDARGIETHQKRLNMFGLL